MRDILDISSGCCSLTATIVAIALLPAMKYMKQGLARGLGRIFPPSDDDGFETNALDVSASCPNAMSLRPRRITAKVHSYRDVVLQFVRENR